MNIFKSHFWYNKNQRNGIFLFAIIIVSLQVVLLFVDFSQEEKIELQTARVLYFHNTIDSLKRIALEERAPKIFPFNPNYITDYKGSKLGMSLEEIDKLLAFRKTGKFVNSIAAFQKVTNISDSLLNKISPYFKFPDWVLNKPLNKTSNKALKKSFYPKKAKHIVTTTDLNKATIEDLRTIYGIGAQISARIIKYRSKLQGFSLPIQLYEVWGLKQEIADKALLVFKISELPDIQKTNVNTVSFRELLKNPYIDYELCKLIFEYRDEVAELQEISELKNINGFPLELYDRIVLYLVAE